MTVQVQTNSEMTNLIIKAGYWYHYEAAIMSFSMTETIAQIHVEIFLNSDSTTKCTTTMAPCTYLFISRDKNVNYNVILLHYLILLLEGNT